MQKYQIWPHATRSSDSLLVTFELSPVRFLTSSNHCTSGFPRDRFPSHLPCKMMFAMVSFTFTKPSQIPLPNYLPAACHCFQCVLQLTCISPHWGHVWCIAPVTSSATHLYISTLGTCVVYCTCNVFCNSPVYLHTGDMCGVLHL